MRELSGPPSAHDGQDFSSDHGLRGRLFRRDLAAGNIVEQAVFLDDVYVYNLRLDAAADVHREAREVFMQLLASCEPLPRVVGRVSEEATSFWAD